MEEEREKEPLQGGEVPPGSSQPLPEETAESPEVEAGAREDAGAGAMPLPEFVPPEKAVASGRTKGGRFRSWVESHKLLAGVALGLLVVALAAGIFAAGYIAAGPHEGRDGGPRERGPQFREPVRPDQRSSPSPDRERGGGEPLNLMLEYRGRLGDVISDALGIEVEELREGMRDGKSIAEMAEERGVSLDELRAAVAAEIGAIAEELAAEGEISEERVERIKERAEAMASRLMEDGFMPLPTPGE